MKNIFRTQKEIHQGTRRFLLDDYGELRKEMLKLFPESIEKEIAAVAQYLYAQQGQRKEKTNAYPARPE